MTKVLIVDDATFMRLSLKTMFEQNGMEVVGEAANGALGVLKYKECNPDVVTMDITMPDMDGVEAVREIKKYDPDAKIIMISAMGQEAMVKKAVLNGASSFIVKPFKEKQLLQTISKVLSI